MRALIVLVSVILLGLFVAVAALGVVLFVGIPQSIPQTPAMMALDGVTGSRVSHLAHPALLGAILPIVFFAMLLLFVLAIIVVAMRMAGREPAQAKSKENAVETRLIQEIYHGLGRMEQRVEALETLLLERVPSSRSVYAPDEPAQRTVR